VITSQPRGTDATGVYSVIALTPPPDGNFAHCLYYDSQGNQIGPKDLWANPHDASIQLTQATQPPNGGQLPPDVCVSTKLRFFAAVAKTLGEGAKQPNLFLATETPGGLQVTLPVTQATTRGVILIFTQVSGDGIKKLLATADPEIKNGTNTG
jgi:hypothetical protein